MEFELPKPRHWYHRWWGTTVIVFGTFFAIFLGLIAITTVRYWWQLRQGQEPAFLQDRYSRFTGMAASAQVAKKVDRQSLETQDDPFLGRSNAPTVIVAFFEYKCPNSKLAVPILKKVAAKYGYAVKIIIRDFPPETLHPGATMLSKITTCAHKQEKFLAMQDVLFNEQDTLPEVLSNTDLEQLAMLADVDFTALKACVYSPETEKEVHQDYLDGVRFGVGGTPTFFVNGERIEGVVPFDAWEKYLDSVLKK